MGSVTESLGMRDRLAEFRRNAARTEDSIQVRAVVLAAVMVAIVAVLSQGVVPPFVAIASLTLTPLGFWVSWRRRSKRNVVLKIALAAALLMALGAFMNQVRYALSVDDARIALASLFLWVQVIHSFDLPRLRDLSFSMSAAVVLMAEAGALSLDMTFGLFLLAFGALAGLWLFLSQQSVARRSASTDTPHRPSAGGIASARKRRFPLGMVAGIAVTVLAAGFAVFLFTPRLPGATVALPPFSIRSAIGIQGFSGQVVNPGGGLSSQGDGAPPSFSPDAYPGFGDSVDLRARGSLSDEIVMKVRAPEAAFWRGQAYDVWDGQRWTASQTTTVELQGDPDFRVPTELDTYAPVTVPVRRLVQTFYVEANQPNLVFAAYRPTNVYFPAPTVEVDPYLSIRAPVILDEGLIYSIISDVPITTPGVLRAASTEEWPQDFLAQYTQLPDDLPDRVRALADRITEDAPTTYDRVLAVQRWLRTNTLYNLNIPPDPEGVDAVDHFLFERREGFCEHLASAMVVLLRAEGIPARFAVGFHEGERNPFTGYLEVRESDAHAWVEVYYPSIGWVQYDPTHGTPVAEGGLASSFVAPEVFRAIGAFLGSITPEPVKQALGSLARGVGALAKGAVAAWPAVVAGLVILLLGSWAISHRSARRRSAQPVGAAAAFAAVCTVFDARGHPRPASATPAEHLSHLLRTDEMARAVQGDLSRVVATFERDRFAPAGATSDDILEALAAADRVRAASD